MGTMATKPLGPLMPMDLVESMSKLLDYLDHEKEHYESCADDEKARHVWPDVQNVRKWMTAHGLIT